MPNSRERRITEASRNLKEGRAKAKRKKIRASTSGRKGKGEDSGGHPLQKGGGERSRIHPLEKKRRKAPCFRENRATENILRLPRGRGKKREEKENKKGRV